MDEIFEAEPRRTPEDLVDTEEIFEVDILIVFDVFEDAERMVIFEGE